MSERPAIEGGEPIRREPIRAFAYIDDDDIREVVEVLKSGRLCEFVGTKVREFEREFARYLGAKHALAVTSGSVALYVALKAIGVGPGDEVIVPAYTFAATATAVVYANAVPVFADIDPETYNIDPRDLEKRITERTKAVIVVHIAGHPADMDEILKIAREHGLYVIEDCAQAVGAEYKGRKVGTIGDIAAFSFYQTKNLTTGEGGMVVTNSDELAERAALIRSHGERGRYNHVTLGFNFRMNEITAALGLSQLRKLDKLNRRRAEIAAIYRDELSELESEGLLKNPVEKEYAKHVWHIYNPLLAIEKLRVTRDRIVEAIKAEGAIVSVAYPKPLYKQKVFLNAIGHGMGCPFKCPFYKGSIDYTKVTLPNTEYVTERVFTLYTFPTLTDDDAVDIARAVKKVVKWYKK